MKRFLSIVSILTCLCLTIVQARTKKALSIGISKYSNTEITNDSTWANIHGENDVVLLTSLLKKQGFQVTSLTDQNATASKIRKEMSCFLQTLKAGDIALFHFSGHGQPVEDQSGDEEDGWDEAIIPVDAQKYYKKGKYSGEYHILDDELNVFFEKMRSKVGSTGVVYVILDACHIGSAYRGDDDEEDFTRGTNCAFSPKGLSYRPRINSTGNFKIEHKDSIGDICILEACRAYQVNREIKQKNQYYGPLSYYFCQWLQTNRLDKDFRLISDIQNEMHKDSRLIRQNMVSETSK